MNTVVLIPFIICLWLSHCAKENRWPLVLYIFILSNFLKAMNWNHIVLNYLEHGNLFDELSKLGTLCKNTLTKINFVNCTWPIFRLMFGHFLTNSCCPARPLSGGGGGEGRGGGLSDEVWTMVEPQPISRVFLYQVITTINIMPFPQQSMFVSWIMFRPRIKQSSANGCTTVDWDGYL